MDCRPFSAKDCPDIKNVFPPLSPKQCFAPAQAFRRKQVKMDREGRGKGPEYSDFKLYLILRFNNFFKKFIADWNNCYARGLKYVVIQSNSKNRKRQKYVVNGHCVMTNRGEDKNILESCNITS